MSTIKSLLTVGGSEPGSATQMLREDHERVQEMFTQFESATGSARKAAIVSRALNDLWAHTAIEEELFYPAVRRELDDDEPVELAYEEHNVAKTLMAELQRMKPGDTHFDAKFKVLGESVRHHINEEETNVLPAAESSDMDLNELGRRMHQRKQQLMSNASGSKRGESQQGKSSRSQQRRAAAARGSSSRSAGKRAAGKPAGKRKTTSAKGRRRKTASVSASSRKSRQGRSSGGRKASGRGRG
jgi:hemerythrin-like domain-containing protein